MSDKPQKNKEIKEVKTYKPTMQPIETFNTLVNYYSPPELVIIEKIITDKQYTRANQPFVLNEDFEVKMEGTSSVIIPIIPPMRRINSGTFRYPMRGKEGEFHEIEGYEIVLSIGSKPVYQRAHQVCIVREFAINDKKQSNEMHENQKVKISTEEFYFWYSFGDRTWKLLEDEEDIGRWKENKKLIDDFIFNSPEPKSVYNAFDDLKTIDFQYKKVKKPDKTESVPLTFKEQTSRLRAALKTAYQYFQLKRATGTVTQSHFQLVEKETRSLLGSLTKEINAIKDKQLNDIQTGSYSHLNSDLQNVIVALDKTYINTKLAIIAFVHASGYWIDDEKGKIYPNPGEQHALNQYATEHRNEESKKQLADTILRAYRKQMQDFKEGKILNKPPTYINPEKLNEIKQAIEDAKREPK